MWPADAYRRRGTNPVFLVLLTSAGAYTQQTAGGVILSTMASGVMISIQTTESQHAGVAALGTAIACAGSAGTLRTISAVVLS